MPDYVRKQNLHKTYECKYKKKKNRMNIKKYYLYEHIFQKIILRHDNKQIIFEITNFFFQMYT